MLKDLFQDLLYRLSQPLIRLLIALRVTPDVLTLLGLLANGWAAWCLIHAAGKGFPAAYAGLAQFGGLVLLGGFFDILDGRVARVSGAASPAGALLDSVLDRYAELVMFMGIGWAAYSLDQPRTLLAAYLAMVFSIMVSYTRARTEGLGQTGSFGLFQRPERLVLISLAALVCGLLGFRAKGDALLWQRILEPALWIVVSGAGFTAFQRLYRGYQTLRKTGS
ncbi:MAG: CDP-alcohol phosphatidyltransferase family protein [Bacteroidetes bacterium]|nr:CDP-alcohol phosphatidyltransferase family protein [Bacteroidota bacterium]